MKKRTYIWIAVVLLVVFALWRFHKPKILPTQPPQQAMQTIKTNIAPKIFVHAPAANPKIPDSPFEKTSAMVLADIQTRYHAGEINKGQAMQEEMDQENKKPLDIYGRVIDQYGQPVVGAKVEGSILLNVDFVHSGGETHFTETDSDGRFSILGIHGVKMGIRPQKEGYIYNLKMPSQRPDNYQPDPNNPVVFTMWKMRGTEKMVSYLFGSLIPHDGTPTTFDIATQKKSPDGDLRVTFSRSPQEIPRGLLHPYDWTAKIEMLHGGLIAENDAYPYFAPDSGYEPSFEFNMSSNNVPWTRELKQNFYIQSSHGQYGRMLITVYTDLTPTRVRFDFWLNASGTQNLEPSSSNQ